MLDLGSLLVSMGLQSEMQSVQKEIGQADVFGQQQQTEQTQSTGMVQAALDTVDNAASSVVNALTPPTQVMTQALDACAVSAPTVDLSLPTSGSSKK